MASFTDGPVRCCVKLLERPKKSPIFCGFSLNRDGVPCFHGVGVICEKHGASLVHSFQETRHEC